MKSSLLPSINPLTETKQIIEFIQESLTKANFSRIVIAISGGIDSATSLYLATKSIRPQNVFPIMLPYSNLSKESIKYAETLLKKSLIPSENIELIDITKPVEDIKSTLKLASPKEPAFSIRTGNIMARLRMIALFDRAKKHNALVLGTENKSEHLLGYFTRFGDSASDIEPIQHLYKSQIYQLAQFLDVPHSIIIRAPTAGLWERQTDEGEFGFTYELADQILYGSFNLKLTPAQLVARGFKKRDIQKILSRVSSNAFKHYLPFVYPSYAGLSRFNRD